MFSHGQLNNNHHTGHKWLKNNQNTILYNKRVYELHYSKAIQDLHSSLHLPHATSSSLNWKQIISWYSTRNTAASTQPAYSRFHLWHRFPNSWLLLTESLIVTFNMLEKPFLSKTHFPPHLQQMFLCLGDLKD